MHQMNKRIISDSTEVTGLIMVVLTPTTLMVKTYHLKP